MKKIFSFLKPYKFQLIIGPVCKLIEAILELMLPTLVAIIIDKGIVQSNQPLVIKVGLLMLLLSIVGYIFSLICQYNASVAATGFSSSLRLALFEKISNLPKIKRDKYSKNTLTNRLTKDVTQLELACAMLIRLVIRAPFICIGSIIMAFLISFKLSIILSVGAFLFILFVFVIIFLTNKIYRRYQTNFDKMALFVFEHISTVRLVKAFTREKKATDEFQMQSKNLFTSSKSVLKISMLLSPVTSLIMNSVIILVLWFGGVLSENQGIEIGSLIAYVNYVTQLLVALIVVTNLIIVYIKAYSSMQRVQEIFDIEDDIIKTNKNGLSDKNTPLILDNISFKFEDNFILQDINLKLKKNESIGILGVMGGGKTTLVHLISGLYTPTNGNVFVSNNNTKNTTLDNISKFIAIAPQHISFLSGTIKDYLTMGKVDATLEEINKATSNALANDIISNLKVGLNTEIEKNGMNFSGGQRQRLSLARAYIKNSDLLIIDDSLNALDSKTYKEILNNLYKTCCSKIILSQRPSTIEMCDRVFKLENCALKEITKEELNAISNLF